jgi:hypothetical protein
MQDRGSQAQRRVAWFHPGEVVVAARVRGAARGESQREAGMRDLLRAHGGDRLRHDNSSLRSFAFDAPGLDASLVFFVQRLARSDDSRSVRDAVNDLVQHLSDLRSDGVEVIGAMPHWHVKAHEAFSGGSPASHPAPVRPDPRVNNPAWRIYRPAISELDGSTPSNPSQSIRVAVLDTWIDLAAARKRAEAFRATSNNQQLISTIEAMQRESEDNHRANAEWRKLNSEHAPRTESGGGEPAPYPMPDHALFVGGLIHGLAPSARLSYTPVLDETGVGDLSMLLLGLQQVLRRKQPDEPLIVNLSLGLLPHPSRLTDAWYGLERRNDPQYERDQDLFDPDRGRPWLLANRSQAVTIVNSLEAGLFELGRYLSLNNCLVVAAAGNDSSARMRMLPRLPARFDTVLGVAATTSDPSQPATYSNMGDEGALGDHVATFGGELARDLQPSDGVIGSYSGEFPSGDANSNGWAQWSGTSFATAIVSGIAANLWAGSPTGRAEDILAKLHDAAETANIFVPELRTPSIPLQPEWRS